MVPVGANESATLHALDDSLVALVRVAAAVAAAGEVETRLALSAAVERVPHVWVEEVLLQSYLFAGFPRALNATHEWRKASGRAAPPTDEGERYGAADSWRTAGEQTCAGVYGDSYEQLRRNIRALHPALDAWMIVEGYGKVLSRPQLDLRRRELCIVAACAAAGQDRQLHSHLRGALHAGASPAELRAVLDSISDLLAPECRARYQNLLARVVQSDVH